MDVLIRSASAALVALLAFLACVPAHAQGIGRMEGQIVVSIVEYLSVAKRQDLEFGRIISGTTAGSVTVDEFGARIPTGGVTLGTGGGQYADFAGFGNRNQRVQISFAAPSITLTNADGPGTMTVNNFTIGATRIDGLQKTGPRYRISSNNGIFSFPVGARLNVGANQPAGNYSGTFSVTVVYQ